MPPRPSPAKKVPRASGAPRTSTHPYLGAHNSVAGGLHLALEEGARLRSGAVQIFTKNSNQWDAKPLDPDSIRLFRETNETKGPFELAAHSSYLINLGSPDPALLDRSLTAFIIELERCEALGVPRLVFHPGAHMGEGVDQGLARVAKAMKQAIAATPGYRTRLVIENTAGQGSCLGHELGHIERLLELLSGDSRVTVCLDTCHLLAAGYDYRTEEGYGAFREELARRVGLERVDWFHVNDSKKDLGARVDRHTHIGDGFVGAKPFGFFLRDPVFRRVPMVLETPKDDGADQKNLAKLRRLSRMDA